MGVTIIYGADEEHLESLVGLEFDEAVADAKNALGISDEGTDSVRLNGKEDPLGTRIVKDGDTISFYKRSGQKGY